MRTSNFWLNGLLTVASACWVGCSLINPSAQFADVADASRDASPPDSGPIGQDGDLDGGSPNDADVDAGVDGGCTCGGSAACIDGECVDTIVQVSAGSSHTCALRASGSVVCWGRNLRGELGDGSSTIATTPTVASLAVADIIDIEAGTDWSCAVHRGGSIECWGTNERGQLGNGGTEDQNMPTAVLGITDAIDVALGNGHACAVRRGGGVFCWGSNSYGEVGTGTLGPRRTPAAVLGVDRAVQVTAGTMHTCVLDRDASAMCWGRNEEGQLGDPSVETGTSMPRQLAVSGLLGVAAGEAFTCAQRDSGFVTCWGINTRGQLGTMTSGITDRPGTDVVGITGSAQVSTGAGFACARLDDGTVWCWGANDSGQLGDGTTDGRAEPRPVIGVAGATWIGAGAAHACAALSDGSVRCWGSNQYGQLGNGRSMETRPTPVRVVGLP